MGAFDIMGAAVIFMMLCWQIPKLFSAVLGGAPALTGGDLLSTGTGLVAGPRRCRFLGGWRRSPWRPAVPLRSVVSEPPPELAEAERERVPQAWARPVAEVAVAAGGGVRSSAIVAVVRSIRERRTKTTKPTVKKWRFRRCVSGCRWSRRLDF